MRSHQNRITDKDEIMRQLRLWLLTPQERNVPFIMLIFCNSGVNWNGRTLQGGLNIEGSRPLSIASSDDETNITLTNGDSNYTQMIGSVKLSEIGYIELY